MRFKQTDRRALLGVPALAAAVLVMAGCGRDDAPAVATAPPPAAAVTPAELQAVDDALVDDLTPAVPGADERVQKMVARERDLTRTILALEQRKNDVIQEKIGTDEEMRALHRQMTVAREVYQQRVQELPEVQAIIRQQEVLRKNLTETGALRRKMSGEG